MDVRATYGRVYSDGRRRAAMREPRRGRRSRATRRATSTPSWCSAPAPAAVEQAGAKRVLLPGDMLLFDNSLPYRLLFDQPFSQTVIQAPRACFGPLAHDLDRCVAQRLRPGGGFGRVLQGFVRALTRRCPTSTTARPRCWWTSCSTCSQRTARPREVSPAADDGCARNAPGGARATCTHTSASPTRDLALVALARAQRVSARTLQRAFASRGSRRHALAARRTPGPLRRGAGRPGAEGARASRTSRWRTRLSRRAGVLPQLQGALRPHAGRLAGRKAGTNRCIRKGRSGAACSDSGAALRVFQTVANAHNSRYVRDHAPPCTRALRPRAACLLLVDADHRQPRPPADAGAARLRAAGAGVAGPGVAVRAAPLLDERTGRPGDDRSHDAHAHGRSHGKGRLGRRA